LLTPPKVPCRPNWPNQSARCGAFAEASKATATRKAYAADLRDFAAYCQRIGALALPADPAVVGTYLATISETKSVATIRRRMVAIAQAHKDAGAPNPVAHRDVQKVLAGIVRTKTVAQKRKDALTTDRLEHAVKALGTGLKGMAQANVNSSSARSRKTLGRRYGHYSLCWSYFNPRFGGLQDIDRHDELVTRNFAKTILMHASDSVSLSYRNAFSYKGWPF
jgi:hypothetical protein